MYCASCASSNRAEFTAEINIHFRGLKNLDKPSVLLVAETLVCLDCGFSALTIPQAGRAILASSATTREASSLEEEIGHITLCA